jgi:hypothetical protein
VAFAAAFLRPLLGALVRFVVVVFLEGVEVDGVVMRFQPKWR